MCPLTAVFCVANVGQFSAIFNPIFYGLNTCSEMTGLNRSFLAAEFCFLVVIN